MKYSLGLREFCIEKEIKMSFKKIIHLLKQFCPPLFWNLLKKFITKKYYGLNQLDRKIETFLDYDGGYYVELGANDGINQSNTYYFEKNRGWKGVLIEPIGHKYMRCVKNRSNKNKIFCNACVSFSYQKKFVEMTYSNLMTISNSLESDIDKPLGHLQEGLNHLTKDETNYTFGSVAETLNNILLRSDAPKKIDFLSLDVEGSEIEVLKGINHKEYRFRYMCIETRDYEKISNYLLKENYLFVKKLSFHDYLFMDNT